MEQDLLFNTSLLSTGPTFHDLVVFPAPVIACLGSVYVMLQNLNVSEFIPVPADTVINNLQIGIVTLIKYTISAAERGMSHSYLDPILSEEQFLARYYNIVNFIGKAEGIWIEIQNIISKLEKDPTCPMAMNHLDWFHEQGTRLRLAINSLTIVVRSMEGVLRNKDPNFSILERQWYE